MVQIIIAVVAVIALYFFIKKYSAIDAKLFENGVDEFVPMGKIAVYISVCLGALIGFVVALYSMFSTGNDNPFELGFSSWGIVCNIIPYLLFASIAGCFYQAFANETTWGRRFVRAFFMLFACLFGFVGGIIGSILVLVVLFLWFLLKLVFAMLTGSASSGSSGSSTPASPEEQYDAVTTDEHGFERKLKSTGIGSYVDDKGDYWKDAENGMVMRDK